MPTDAERAYAEERARIQARDDAQREKERAEFWPRIIAVVLIVAIALFIAAKLGRRI